MSSESAGLSRISWPDRQAHSALPPSLQISEKSTLGRLGNAGGPFRRRRAWAPVHSFGWGMLYGGAGVWMLAGISWLVFGSGKPSVRQAACPNARGPACP
jgi:hypothetical protein